MNIKKIEFTDDKSRLNEEYLNVNFKVAGGLLKEKIQDLKNTLKNMDNKEMKELVTKFHNEKTDKIDIEGFGEISKDAFNLDQKPKSNIVMISENDYTVALDTDLTEDLIIEGMARDLVRTLQVLRKEAGLKVEEHIELSIMSKGKRMQKIEKEYMSRIAEDTLTDDLYTKPLKKSILKKEIEINGEKVNIEINPK